jgi:hypothetical protein
VSGPSDEYDEMSSHVGVPGAPPAGDQDDVARFLVELRALGEGQPPTPSPELAALLGGATPLQPRRRPASYRIAARGGLAAAALIAALVAAAANHDLPQPAQRVVSNVVDVLTPFRIAPAHEVPTPSPTPSHPVIVPGGDESSGPGGESSGPGDESSAPGEGSDEGIGTRGGGGDGAGSDDGAGSTGGDGAGSDDGAGSAGGAGGAVTTSAPRTSGEDGGGSTTAPRTSEPGDGAGGDD